MSNSVADFPIPVVRLILLDDHKRVLLLQRAGGAYDSTWCLPGGKIDYGGTVEETIRKELKEETDLDMYSFRLLFLQDSLPTHPGEKHYLNLYFECEWNGIVTLNHESCHSVWIDETELAQYKIVFDNDEALQYYWGFREKV
jgi:ADP-ribose pyrophosphatase YjhB (NUDIX family)